MSYVIGIFGIIGAMLLWMLVQILWKKVFSDEVTDTDVLAMRRSCGSCGCTTSCKVKKNENRNLSKLNTH